MGKFDAARKDIDAALRSQPGNPVAGYYDAFFLGRDGKYKEAIERLERVQGLEDYFPPALDLSAALNYMVGNLERARQPAEKFVSRQPNSVPGRTLLAAILLRQSEPQKAIDQLQPIVTPVTTDFNAIVTLATAYTMVKQPTEGCGTLRPRSQAAPG